MKIDLSNETDVDINKSDVQKWVKEELLHQRRDIDTEIEVLVVAPGKMRRLNKKYRHKDAITDVLSFPLYNKIPRPYSSSKARTSRPSGSNDNTPTIIHLGSIVLCAQVAQKQADASHRSLNTELELLIRHSVKHLIGIHHR